MIISKSLTIVQTFLHDHLDLCKLRKRQSMVYIKTASNFYDAIPQGLSVSRGTGRKYEFIVN